MKKRFIAIALCVIMTLSLGVTAACAAGAAKKAASPAYSLVINGKTVTFDKNSAPAGIYVKNNRIMVPLRAAAEKLGCKVKWDAKNNCAVLSDADCSLNVYLGDDSLVRTSNKGIGATAPASYGAASEAKNGRTYVPVRLFELFDCTVAFKNNTVTIDKTADSNSQIPNPLVEYGSIAEAQKAVSFKIKTPASLKDTKIDSVIVIDSSLAEINYAGGICWRTAAAGADNGDISGDYNTYASVNTLSAGGQTVTVKGSGSNVSLAYWTDGTNSYSAAFDTPVTADYISAMVSSVG